MQAFREVFYVKKCNYLKINEKKLHRTHILLVDLPPYLLVLRVLFDLFTFQHVVSHERAEEDIAFYRHHAHGDALLRRTVDLPCHRLPVLRG